jgi:hypothetical protein
MSEEDPVDAAFTAWLNSRNQQSSAKPDGAIDYDEAGNPFIWQGGKLVKAPAGTPLQRNSTVNPPPVNVSIQQTQPVSTQAALSLDELTAQVESGGGVLTPRGGIWVATWPDKSQTRYDPTGFPRNGQVSYNPTYVAPPASSAASGTTRRPTPLEISAQALGNANRMLNSATPAPASTLLTDAESAAQTAPVGQRPMGQERGIIRSFSGQPVVARIDNGPGGIQDIPLNSSNVRQDLAMFGLTPTGNIESDARTALASRGWIADELARNRSSAEISNQLDLYRGRNQSRQGRITAGELNAVLEPESVPTDFSMPAREPNVDFGMMGDEEDEEFRTYADGGQALIGGGGWTDSLSRKPNREGENFSPYQMATRQLAERGYRPMDKPYTGALYDGGRRLGMVPPWLLPQWGRGARQGMGYGPGQDRAMAGWAADGYIGGIPHPNEPHESYTGNAVNSYPGAGVEPRAFGAANMRRVGNAPRFANGGTQMLDEPVLGVGMMSNEPKFMAGEAGPEMATFTPVGQRPQEQTNAPYPQAQRPVQLLDPRRVLMSMKRRK